MNSEAPRSTDPSRIVSRKSDAPPSMRDRPSTYSIGPQGPARAPSATYPAVAAAAAAAVRCKGVVFVDLLELVRDAYGDDMAQRTLSGLPGDLATMLEVGAVDIGDWYPLAWYDALHVAAQGALGRGVDLAREVGRETTRRELSTGIYRVFLKILWPDLVVQKSPLIFGRYFEQGTMRVLGRDSVPFDLGGRKHVDAIWDGCHGFTKNLWEDVAGGCEGGLLAAGAREVVVEITAGGGDGDTACAARASYR